MENQKMFINFIKLHLYLIKKINCSKRMEQGTTMNQSRIVEELSKPEVQLSPQQLGNSEVVQKTIKRYQNKISEMLKIIQKQRKHNESLKSQLKQLNDNLNVMIEKINIKSQKKDEPNKQDATKKQLQNEIKKNVVMKKELDILRTKVKLFEGQKIIDLQDEIRQKDKVIEEMNNTIKMYSKIQKQEMNIDIYKKYNEANEKINSLNGELIHLKKKLTQSKKSQEQHQKSIKRQHQQLLSIQKKQKSSLSIVKKQQLKQENASNETSKLKQKLQALQNAKKMSEKAFRVQIQNLKNKNKILEQDLEDYKSQINRKDKQANIMISKMKQFSRKSHQALQPVQKMSHKSEDISNSSNLFDHRKQFKGLMHLQNNSRKFDDTDLLPLERSYKIKAFKFVWFQEHILSLSTTYELLDSTTKDLQTFSISHKYKNTKEGGLDFHEFEYINEIEIYCSRFIEFIKIKTSRNHVLEVGNEKNHAKCKKFTYDIRTNEKPIAFMGAIETKKLGGNDTNGTNKEHLISFGLEIKKKDVFTKNRFNPSVQMRSQSLMKKAASRTGFVSKQQNDKNIVEEHVEEHAEQHKEEREHGENHNQ